MEKHVIVDLERGPKPVGKTNWSQIRSKQDKPPVIDDEAPEFTNKAALFNKKDPRK